MLLDEDEQLTIPYQHTTAAHKLLWWPSIRALVDQDLLTQETYVIDEEENRGVLKIYGRGEGSENGDALFQDDSDSEYMSSGSDPDSSAQHIGFNPNSWDSSVEPDGGIGPEGEGHSTSSAEQRKLRFDRQTVLQLLNSYLANIHILHPILDAATITTTALRFTDHFEKLEEARTAYPTTGIGVVSDNTGNQSPAARGRTSSVTGKRKRGSAQTVPQLHDTSDLPQLEPHPRKRHIPRNVHAVLVLLVLALGSICLHRAPVPGPLPRESSFGSPGYMGADPYTTTPPAGSGAQDRGQGGQRRELRNVDVIPGLGYFSQALDILGGLIGSNKLENVQAGLLAGLYWGQLGRVLDSWKWISWACMGCQILIRMYAAVTSNHSCAPFINS